MSSNVVTIRLTEACSLAHTPGEDEAFDLDFALMVGRRDLVVATERYALEVEEEARGTDRASLCTCWFCERRRRSVDISSRQVLTRVVTGICSRRLKRRIVPVPIGWRRSPAGSGSAVSAGTSAAKIAVAAIVALVGIAGASSAFQDDWYRDSIFEKIPGVGRVIDTLVTLITGGGGEKGIKEEDISLHTAVVLKLDGQLGIRGWLIRDNMVPGETVQGTLTVGMEAPGSRARHTLSFLLDNRLQGQPVGRALDEVMLVKRLVYAGDDLLSSTDGGMNVTQLLDGAQGMPLDGRVSLRELSAGISGLPAPGPAAAGGSRFTITVQFDPRVTGDGLEFSGQRLHPRLVFGLSEVHDA